MRQISIVSSNIYPLLFKLKDKELIEFQKDESDRKFDQLSEKGKKFVKTIGLTIQKFNGHLLEMITGTLRWLHGTKVQFKDC